MAAIGALSFSTILISGCALPVPLQVASWALDGVSYVMTEKSITDHGLSVVAQKDCAVWRGVTEGELCREWNEDEDTFLASISGLADGPFPSIEGNGMRSLTTPISISNDTKISYFRQDILPVTKPSQHVSITSKDFDENQKPMIRGLDSQVKRLASASPKTIFLNPLNEPVAGIYFVIGSFRNYGNARNLASKQGLLLPTVLTAKLKKSSIYRVVVGPVEPGAEKALYKKIAGVGFQDIWAIRVQPGDWSLANGSIKQVKRRKMNPELAKLPY